MTTPGEQYPQYPVPVEHDAFLASLGHNELFELGKLLHGENYISPWRMAFIQERIARERKVEDMRAYLPSGESPPYDAEAGPEAYIEQIRQFNRTQTFNYGAYPLKKEKTQARRLADEYVSRNCMELREITRSAARLSVEELEEFFDQNLRRIILLPRMLGVTDFESQKYSTVRKYMPDTRMRGAEVGHQIRKQNVTRAQIDAAYEAVMGLPCQAPLPDFFQIPEEHQGNIVNRVGAEWLKLCELIVQYNPHALASKVVRTQASLAYHPVTKLLHAVEQYTLVKPHEICRIFLRSPGLFESLLEKADAQAQHQVQLQEYRDQQVELQQTKPQPMSENMLELQRLTNDPDVNDAVLDAAFGEEVPLTTPDQLVIGPKFDEIAAKHTELIGRALWELMPDQSASGVRIGYHGQFSVGSALRGKHRGNMRNLTVKRVPVTAEEMAAELKNYNPVTMLPEHATRLIFLAEIKPTGRKPEQTYLSMILTVIKSPTGRDVIEMNKRAAKATGSAVALSLQMDAEARGRAVELGAWKAPAIRTGLPSLGRNREQSRQQKR